MTIFDIVRRTAYIVNHVVPTVLPWGRQKQCYSYVQPEDTVCIIGLMCNITACTMISVLQTSNCRHYNSMHDTPSRWQILKVNDANYTTPERLAYYLTWLQLLPHSWVLREITWYIMYVYTICMCIHIICCLRKCFYFIFIV